MGKCSKAGELTMCSTRCCDIVRTDKGISQLFGIPRSRGWSLIRKLPISCILDFILNTYCGGWVADSIGGSNWAHINGFLSSKLPAKQDVHIIFVMILPCR